MPCPNTAYLVVCIKAEIEDGYNLSSPGVLIKKHIVLQFQVSQLKTYANHTKYSSSVAKFVIANLSEIFIKSGHFFF